MGLVKPYVDPALGVNDENATAYEEQPDDNAEDYNITEFEESLDEARNEQGVRLDSEASSWEKVPDEIVEMILIYAINTPDQVLETYQALLRSCNFNIW